MKILTVEDNSRLLETKSRIIKKIDQELVDFLRQLGKTLKDQRDPEGVGLSAVQIGKPIRVFALKLPRSKQVNYYLNPRIIGHSTEKNLGEDLIEPNEGESPSPFLEGCLSVPEVYGPVLRWPRIRVQAAILSKLPPEPSILGLQPQTLTLENLSSRVFQHELDHLNGILFTRQVLGQGGQLYRQIGDELEAMEL